MSTDYSRQALLDFLDYLGNKGLVNKATISARKAASNALLDILNDEEAKDLRGVDVDQLALRFSNLKGDQFTPASLNTYKSRFTSALQDFLSYRENPMAFKPGLSPRVRRKAKSSDGSEAPAPSTSSEFEPRHARFVENVVPVQIRSDVVVQIVGLPPDLTTAEAQRISKIVAAYVAEE